MEHLEHGDFTTFIERQHAMLKSPAKRGPPWPDVKTPTAAVEIKPVRMVGLLDASCIDNGDLESEG